MGALVPLSDAMPDFATYSAQVFPGPLQTTFWQGKYYGLPLDTNTRVLIYNKTLYNQAGIESPPATVAQFESDMNRVKALGSDVYGFADGGTYAWAIMPWIWSYGGDITDPNMTTSSGYINGQAAVTAVTKWKQWLDSGLLSPNLLGGGIGTADGVGKNLYANILDGPWMTPIFGKQYPDLQYEYALMPAGPAGSISVIGGEDLTVFQAGQHQAEAIEFARFMLSADAQLEMGKAGQVPVLSSLTGDPSLPPYFSVFMQQLQTARARLPHPRWAKMDSAITDAVQAALRGADVQTALDSAADQINVLLAG
jgi:multiple sugar transport system substrate-binding protein